MVNRERSHRRGAAVRDGVLSAAATELMNRGFEAMTIANVAKRAGVHASSVYRRWKTKEQLVTDALLAHLDATVDVPDTGDLRADLIGLLRSMRESLNSPQATALLRLAAMPVEFDRLTEARHRVYADRMTAMGLVITRAQKRGEIDESVQHELALELLQASIYQRALLTFEPVTDAFIVDIVDLLLSGLRSEP